MIPLDMHYGFVIYLFIWFVLISFLWGRELWKQVVYDWSLSKDRLGSCGRCHYAFLVGPGENITRCPRCNEVCIIKNQRRF
ncbi:MAG: hypothetical protein A2X49_15520 [Lentisphaerae bacterium GWF2_52_8]|nr:MAG: hypothetical protein A2X49_15520 [Lentisphaerae bacterium GWF2_52_8]